MVSCSRLNAQTQQQQQYACQLETEDLFLRHNHDANQTVRSSHSSSPIRSRPQYQRMQYRRMYRYGMSLLIIGALCNWIGFAQHYFAAVRYLGVGCVVAGALCVCMAVGRWLSLRSYDSTANQEISSCGTFPSVHVITVPVQGADPFQIQHQQPIVSKPPDYETAIGSKPPSYDEAIMISPVVFLQPPLNVNPETATLTESQTGSAAPFTPSSNERQCEQTTLTNTSANGAVNENR